MTDRLSRRVLWMHKLADEVVRVIAERVKSGTYAPGMKLGTREELAGEFVTSLAVMDRALETLLARNLVDRGPAGVYVVPMDLLREGSFEVARSPRLEDVAAIMELRLGVEAVAAGLAASRHDAEGLAAIRAAEEAFEAAAGQGEARAAARADFLFHRAIAAASGNRYILELLEYLGPLAIPRMRDALPSGGPQPDMHLRHSVEEHRAIVAAIEAGDPEAADAAMDAHLTRALTLVRGLNLE